MNKASIDKGYINEQVKLNKNITSGTYIISMKTNNVGLLTKKELCIVLSR